MSDAGLLVPLFALAIPVVAIWTKHKRQVVEMHLRSGAGPATQANADLARKTAELEDRIRVLERIVTDGNYNLASQIEALRHDDTPLPRPGVTTPSSLPDSLGMR